MSMHVEMCCEKLMSLSADKGVKRTSYMNNSKKMRYYQGKMANFPLSRGGTDAITI